MKSCALLFLAALLSAQSMAAAPNPPGPPAPAKAPESPAGRMAAFRFFVGTWQPVKNPAATEKTTETYTLAPILDGAFLISQEIFRDQDGKIVYRDFAVFGIDPDTNKLFLHAYNTDGSIDRTRQIDSPPGEWVFLGTVYGSPRFKDYRYTMTKLDENHMRVLIELLKDGKYDKLSETLYERTPQPPLPQVQ